MDLRVLDEAISYLNDEEIADRPIYESLCDDFTFTTLLSLAEQEMFNDISGIVLESADIIALNEGVKETIMKYVTKVIQGIQNAWNKFKNIVTEKEHQFLEKTAKPAIDKANDNTSFQIKNYKTYDYTKLNSIEIVPFDYEKMKDSLESVDKFIETNYPGIPYDQNNKDLRKSVEKAMNVSVSDVVANKEFLTNLYQFAYQDIDKYKAAVENDIKNLNNSSENIKNMVNTVMNAETPATESTTISTGSILEADTDGGNAENSQKMSFVDNSGETSSGDPSKAKEENKQRAAVTKAVTNYMTGSTKILSAKMAILNDATKNAFLILTHFAGSTGAATAKNAATNKVNNAREKISTAIAPKVDTEEK